MDKITLCGLTADEISGIAEAEGFSSRNGMIIANQIYKKRLRVLDNVSSIPLKLRKYLGETAETGLYDPVNCERSADKTEKFLFRNSEGRLFETVFIPEGKRNTVCVSTQSGCRMGCSMCATARYGYHGNLSAGDIVNQVLSLPASDKITHIVFMGMGEPFDNLPEMLRACEILTAQWGLSISPRNITVSTVGIDPGIAEFLALTSCNLTLSLLSPFADERKKFVPAEQKYPVKDILDLVKSFPVRKKRRLSIAYVMIRGINDTTRHLEELIRLLVGARIRVNLVPYNPCSEDDYMPSAGDRMMYFKHNLVIAGISASIRKPRGADISAACGLLAGRLK